MHQCETEFPCKVETLLAAWDDLSRGEAASCCDCSVCTCQSFSHDARQVALRFSACFCCAALAQTDCVACHSCHTHVDAPRECTSNVAGAGTGSAGFDSFWCPFQRCLANMKRSASLPNHVSNANLQSSLKMCENMRMYAKIWGLPSWTFSNHKLLTLVWQIHLCTRFSSD